MGDHGRPSGLMPNGLIPDEVASVTRVLEAERWSMAEERTAELIACIQPNETSEERRRAVANYVKRLITNCFSCQVFTFGSVPLKTYLPDGDIDLTTFSKDLDLKDTWANEVREILENEEKSETAEFHVKEVQYIQAEVKIIKCLVENIVVDISFNQLGGLCTLCFLEEIDNLISQDHLFKRSIILIKAWCYYESRVLGAHHGLISTYALETLVLYIFHVFNNSFAGPLEVLYRFLEFFSNFDWDKYCVSLWGPVPISSLPDMTAEPPRKDSGDLLLSQLFLNACSTVYAVFPTGQETQSQPFVSKHFNVIDPLRINNNLGRSVSKGNFYRIRSAFQLGAERLAGLLECQKESINTEIDKFFTDTWQRHWSGNRPDAATRSPCQLQTASVDFSEDLVGIRNDASTMRREDNTELAAHRDNVEEPTVFSKVSSQSTGSVNQFAKDVNRTGSLFNSLQKQKDLGSYTSCKDQIERSIHSSEYMQHDKKCSKNSRPDYFVKDHVAQARLQLARPHSSPELTDGSTARLSTGRLNRFAELVKNHLNSARTDHGGFKKKLSAEVPGGYGAGSMSDNSSSARISSHHGLHAAVDSINSSSSHHGDSSRSVMGGDLASVSETLERHQEEQDLVNMMAASRLYNLNGQAQPPIPFLSHLSVPSSPALASMECPQRNIGIIPANITFIEPHWGYDMQFHQVHPVSSALPHYSPDAMLESNAEEMMESGNEASCMKGMNRKDEGHDFCPDEDAGSSQMNFPAVNSGNPFKRGQPKFVRGNRGFSKEDHGNASGYPNPRQNNLCSVDRSEDLRFASGSQVSSPTSSISSEPLDTLSMKTSRSSREKQGRRPSAGLNLSYERVKTETLCGDPSPDHASVLADVESGEWSQQSMLGNDAVEQNMVSSSLAPAFAENYQLPSHHQFLTSGSDSVIPVRPMIFYTGPQHRIGNTPGNTGSIFYPTGVPLVYTMFPVHNFPPDSINSDEYCGKFNQDSGYLTSSNLEFDLPERPGQPEAMAASGSVNGAAFEQSGKQKPDILNSDFSSHWQNLQFGRFCQHTGIQGSPCYTSPVMAPPLYLQGHFPLDGPGRPLPANANLFPQNMNYRPPFVPVMSLQTGLNMAADTYQHHGDDVQRYRRVGTGIYPPKPKVSRDRQSSNVRNHRGNYNHEKNNFGDREGSWIGSKSRAPGRGHGRTQFGRPNTRLDRLPSRSWDPYKHERISPNEAESSSFSSTSTGRGSTNVGPASYQFPSANSNGLSPVVPAVSSVMMVYKYDPSSEYGSSAGQVEFGSFGSVHLSGLSEEPHTIPGGLGRTIYEQRSDQYQSSSPCSSPDLPSSPHLQRGLQ